MAGQPESQELIQQIQTLKDKTHKLQQLTQQALEVMRQQGFRIKLNIDVDALMRETETDIRKIQRAGFELEQRVGQYEELVRTFALINSSLDQDKVLEEVMDTVIGLTGAERGYLMMTQPDGEFSIRSARNWDRETLTDDS